ncbi:hypothetical protein [Gluconacetobacter sacchari]|uniref:hypothetical protein n=1 Tax=Gluconacetobacter sacchari TaxID=92759 RepID=UPI001C821B24|nr:hypothetical protein [Gluconacetobacter sacchari]
MSDNRDLRRFVRFYSGERFFRRAQAKPHLRLRRPSEQNALQRGICGCDNILSTRQFRRLRTRPKKRRPVAHGTIAKKNGEYPAAWRPDIPRSMPAGRGAVAPPAGSAISAC